MAIVLSRVVPAWFFRCRNFTIFRMPAPGEPVSQELTWTVNAEQRQAAEALSKFRASSTRADTRACVAIVDAQVVATLWQSRGFFDETELGLRIGLAPDLYWLFSAYVDPQWRRQGIYRDLVRFVTDPEVTRQAERRPEATRQEVPRPEQSHPSSENPGIAPPPQPPRRIDSFLAINPHNLRSMAAHRALNAQPLARVLAIRFLGLAWCRVRNLCDPATMPGDRQRLPFFVHTQRNRTWKSRRQPMLITISRVDSDTRGG